MFVDNLPSRRRPFSENIPGPFSEVATKCETSSREKRQDKMHILMCNDKMDIVVKLERFLWNSVSAVFPHFPQRGHSWQSVGHEGEICLNVLYTI